MMNRTYCIHEKHTIDLVDTCEECAYVYLFVENWESIYHTISSYLRRRLAFSSLSRSFSLMSVLNIDSMRSRKVSVLRTQGHTSFSWKGTIEEMRAVSGAWEEGQHEEAAEAEVEAEAEV